jgi:hypothetical protein
MNRLALVLGAISVVLLPVLADSTPTDRSLPIGFTLARAPELAHWTVTYTYDATDKPVVPAPPPAVDLPPPPPLVLPQELSVTKSGRIYHSELRIENGPDVDQWWVDGIQLSRTKGETDYMIYHGAGGEAFGNDFQRSDFPDLDWIGPAAYSGVETIEGTKCFVFRTQVPVAKDDDPDALSAAERIAAAKYTMEITAWISIESRLPLREARPGRKADYRFSSPPGGSLEVPSDVGHLISASRAASAKMTRPGPPP